MFWTSSNELNKFWQWYVYLVIFVPTSFLYSIYGENDKICSLLTPPQSELRQFADTVVGGATGAGLSGGQVCSHGCTRLNMTIILIAFGVCLTMEHNYFNNVFNRKGDW